MNVVDYNYWGWGGYSWPINWPSYGCPYCAPRCPCCGRPLAHALPYITWTVNTTGVLASETAAQACDGKCQGAATNAGGIGEGRLDP